MMEVLPQDSPNEGGSDDRQNPQSPRVEIQIDRDLEPLERLKALRKLVQNDGLSLDGISLRVTGSEQEFSLSDSSLEELSSAIGYQQSGLPEEVRRQINETRIAESVREIYRNIGPATADGAVKGFDQLLVLDARLEEIGIPVGSDEEPLSQSLGRSDGEKLIWEYLVSSHDVVTAYDRSEMKFAEEKSASAYKALGQLRRAVHEYTEGLDPDKISTLRQEIVQKAEEYGKQ